MLMLVPTQRSQRVESQRAELTDLSRVLAAHGVPNGGIREMDFALDAGPNEYAARLARDDAAWTRFRHAFDALRTGDIGTAISRDSITLGALAWMFLIGRAFMDAVMSRLA